MNATIIHKTCVKSSILDELAKELPTIISGIMQVTGGNLAILRPEQVSLEFTEASLRDIGSDIRIIVFAKNNDPRASMEHENAKAILEKVIALIARSGEKYSADIRLYLMEIAAAEYS